MQTSVTPMGRGRFFVELFFLDLILKPLVCLGD